MTKEELNIFMENYCKVKNVDINLFGYGISKANISSNGQLTDSTTINNAKCKYYITVFSRIDLVVIWDYKNNKNRNCTYKTLCEALELGKRTFIKRGQGIKLATNNYVDKISNLESLLNYVLN